MDGTQGGNAQRRGFRPTVLASQTYRVHDICMSSLLFEVAPD